jgi:hypothetical protein
MGHELEMGAQENAVWDGITKPESLDEAAAELRQNLADACKRYDWDGSLKILSAHPELINSTRPGGKSKFTPLHQAAHGGASIEVVNRLLGLGAFRTIRDSRGMRPLDVAVEQSKAHLFEKLEPGQRWTIDASILRSIQTRFHKLIRKRAQALVDEHCLRLPELETMLEVIHKRFWFAIPGMYGGFAYWLDDFSLSPRLLAESWCRVVGGSGERHEITAGRTKLVDVGFDY